MPDDRKWNIVSLQKHPAINQVTYLKQGAYIAYMGFPVTNPNTLCLRTAIVSAVETNHNILNYITDNISIPGMSGWPVFEIKELDTKRKVEIVGHVISQNFFQVELKVLEEKIKTYIPGFSTFETSFLTSMSLESLIKSDKFK